MVREPKTVTIELGTWSGKVTFELTERYILTDVPRVNVTMGNTTKTISVSELVDAVARVKRLADEQVSALEEQAERRSKKHE